MCPVCSAQLPADTKFCDECGAATSGTAPAPAAPAETRKVVTVVFADLAGSTSLQERMDPESARRTMDRFYALMREAVRAHGGTVVKVMGDGVMAAFGVPQVAEDDAVRAVRAAAAMHDAFASLDIAGVGLRVGVNTGEVVVSERDDDVVGDAVNVAARLEHAAAVGDVLVGETTWRLARDAATFDPVAPLTLKGKTEPVPAFRLVATGSSSPAPSTRAPFVGRHAELMQLVAAFERAVDMRAPQLAVVIGSPGLGKSRLAAELCATVRSRGAAVFEATCDATATAAYAPLVDVVAALQRDADDGRAVAIADSLLGRAAPATPEETFWAVRRLLELASARQPTVLVVDDVQWAEALLLDLIEHVVEWATDSPLLVVALARPEIRELRPTIAERHGTLTLTGLDDEAAASLLGDLPAELRDRVLATADGNPLFLRELLRMVAEDGADAVDVPPTIHALLAARIERLRPTERAVVERASVVGHEFYRGAVAELIRTTTASVDGDLETLRRKELVEPEGTYWIDEPVFRFHHALIRDAAYRRLLKEARAELHQRFAEWLEAKVGTLVGDHEEAIGYHLEQAHEYRRQLGTDDVALGRRAAEHLAAAASRALQRDDLSAAVTLSGRALDRLDAADALRATALLDHCEALLATGNATPAVDAVAALREVAQADPRLNAWADCFAAELRLLTESRDLREVAGVLATAGAALDALGDNAGAAKAHSVHARVLARLGRVAECEASLDLALAAARAVGDRRRGNAVLASAPVAALWGPSPVARASGRCLDVVRVLRITAGAPTVEATALRCQAVLEAIRGRHDAARQLIAQARELVVELGLAHALLETDLYGGIVEIFAAEWEAARRELARAYDGFVALGASSSAALAAVHLARALLELGRDAEAATLSVECERLGGEDLQVAVGWRSVRAVALARRGDLATAERLAREAVTLVEPTDALVDEASARHALAAVLRVAGRNDDAETEATLAEALLARKKGDAETAAAGRESGGVHTIQAEGSDFAVTLMTRWIAALEAEDWERAAAHYAVDFVMTDHRSGLRSEMTGRDNFIAAAVAIYSGRGLHWTVKILAAEYPAALVQLRSQSDDVNRSFFVAGVLNGEHQFAELHQFEETDVQAAFAEFDRMVAERSPARAALGDLGDAHWIAATAHAVLYEHAGALHLAELSEGAVTTTTLSSGDMHAARLRLALTDRSPHTSRWLGDLVFEAHTVRAWDEYQTVFDPDVELEDRRAGHAWPVLRGREGVVQRSSSGTAVAADFAVVDREWVWLGAGIGAMRSVVRGHDATGGAMEVGRITVGFQGDHGIRRMVFFDSDDYDGALALAHGTSARGLLHAFVAAHNARDWQALRTLMTDDFVLEDRRAARTWSDRLDRDAFVARAQNGVELAADLTAGLDQWFRVQPHVAVGRMTMRGHVDRSGVAGNADRVAVVFGDGERVRRLVFFEPDDVDAALGIAAEQHACAVALDRAMTSWQSGAWDEFRALAAPDFRYEPRRLVSITGTYGVEELVANLQAQTGLGMSPGRQRTVATRGDSVALLCTVISAADGSGFDHLQVTQIDPATGLMQRVVSFDPEDEDAAFAELEATYRSTLAPAVLAAQEALDTLGYAVERGDWDAYVEFLRPAGVVRDHRTLGLGELPVDEWVTAMSSLLSMLPDRVVRTINLDAIDGNGSVARIRITGNSTGGNAVEFYFRGLSVIRDGKAKAFELFDDDQVEAALVRYRVLTS